MAGEVNLELREEYLSARLAWIRAGRPTYKTGFDPARATDAQKASKVNRHPLMGRYIQTRQADNRSGDLMSVPFWELASTAPEEFGQWQYRSRLREYLRDAIIPYHTAKIDEIADAQRVRRLLNSYSATMTVNFEMTSGGQRQAADLAVLVGRQKPGTAVEPQSTELRNAIQQNVPVRDAGNQPVFRVAGWGANDATGSTSDPNVLANTAYWMESAVWYRCARLAFTLTNKTDQAARIGTPDDRFEDLQVGGRP